MKIFHAAFAALLITGSMFVQPAHAQSTPQESYRTSCTDARVEDRTVCRFADGREQKTSLTDVNRWVGDIGNDNGAPTCAVTGSQWRRTVAGKEALGCAPKALFAPGIIGLPWVG
jgi:hypothetical protein